MKKVCEICSKEFITDHKIQRFCSRICGYKGRIIPKNKGQFKRGRRPWHAGKPLPEFYKKSLSRARMKSKYRTGKLHPKWKGGVYRNEREKAMSKGKYFKWRLKVFKRDYFTCQICGLKKSNHINAHHVLPWKDYPKYRYRRNNGLTLCVDCHKEIHKKCNYDINCMPKETRDYVRKVLKIYQRGR